MIISFYFYPFSLIIRNIVGTKQTKNQEAFIESKFNLMQQKKIIQKISDHDIHLREEKQESYQHDMNEKLIFHKS